MRAEQRIGRIDRIGGHPVVHIRNYFYEDTVESRVYQALSRRINLFEWVIGELQPILSGVERTIQELALMRKEERKARIEDAISHLNSEYDDLAALGLNLDDYVPGEVQRGAEETPPLALKDLVFRADPVGSRVGKIVLVQYRGPEDPETGGAYTVKKYDSEKVPDGEGGWKHERIVLSPLNLEYAPIALEEDQAESVNVVAEVVGKLAHHL